MKKQYDLLWKIILEPFFYDFLQLVDPKLAATIDEHIKPAFLDKELIRLNPEAEGPLEQRIVDKLVKMYTKSGTEEWILFHVEVQHTYSKDFAERMYQYFHSLHQKFRKPITAYAIFTEPGGVKRSSVFKINCGNTTLQYKFNTYKIALQDDDALMNHPNPFALVVLIARQTILKRMYKDKVVHDEELLASKLQIANLIFERRLPSEKESNLIKFLFYYVDFEIKETNTTFERSIQLLTHKNIEDMTMDEAILEEKKFEGLREGLEKGRKEGLEKGRKEGQQLGKKESEEAMVTRMIQMQLLSDEQIVKIAEVPPGFVRRLRKHLEKIN